MHLAAVHRIVVFVGVWRDLTIQQEHPSPGLRTVQIFLMLIQEWRPWHLLVYGEFRVGHEVVDGVWVLGFLNALVEGAMERLDHFDLYRGGGGRKHEGEDWPVEQRTGGWRRKTKPKYKTLPLNNQNQTHKRVMIMEH